jgi:hypothetical protein
MGRKIFHFNSNIMGQYLSNSEFSQFNRGYYLSETLNERDLETCRRVWHMIIENNVSQISSQLDKEHSSKRWFCHVTYDNFMKLEMTHVSIAFMIQMNKAVNVVIRMISLRLSASYNQASYYYYLMHELHSLHKIGIEVQDFYVIGEVLLSSLQTVLGCCFLYECQRCWAKLYSSLLRMVIAMYAAFDIEDIEKSKEQNHQPIISILGVS